LTHRSIHKSAPFAKWRKRENMRKPGLILWVLWSNV
jgi:hypothetical protein